MSRTYCLNDFSYDLPVELIAQLPLPERTDSRLLQINRHSGSIQHGQFTNITELLRPHDILVLNDTKVFPARLYGNKSSGGRVECLIERIMGAHQALAHIRASKAPKVGSQIIFTPKVSAEVLLAQGGLYLLQFDLEEDLLVWLEQIGEMPLPPYIERKPEAADQQRYQTVYAQQVGAIAAPTAGLHFDEKMLAALAAQQINIAKLTLHVGAGTFQPVRVDNITEHRMHKEYLEVSQALCIQIAEAKAQGGRVIAVGTTSMRGLETAARNGKLLPYRGDTDIFIYPGFQFNCVDAMITNFHLPKSTLMMLVSAFAGYDLIMDAYRQAVMQSYRFFSYGDAMFIY